MASSVQIKQQLPLKLATKLGNSGNSIVGSVTGPQQMLPLKLREGAGGDAKKTTAYQRLSTTPPQLPTHSRTGSSPAMMQNIQVVASFTNVFYLDYQAGSFSLNPIFSWILIRFHNCSQ